jgi:transposase
MHSDTTTVSFYGEYDEEKMDLTEEEKETILHIERGYNKDDRRECKQVVVGQITNEYGIPVVNRVLDGSSSDIEWNREAIRYAACIAEAGFKEGIFVADCKLVTEEHVTTMNDPEKRIQFVSRCPANFSDTLERRTIAKAYENGQWETIGSISDTKGAAQYKGVSFIEEICGAPMRLLVLESDSLRHKAEQAFAKKEGALIPLVKALEKQQWMCLADAEAERGRFLALKQLTLFDCEINIEMETTEKWPRGRRGVNTKPSIIETYHLHVEKISKSEPEYREFLQRESSFVLISNVVSGMSDEDLLRTYKGQQVVENSFRILKSPQLASVIYLKNQNRIQVLNMLLSFALLIRALIQYRLREGLKSFNEQHPGEEIYAGWGGRPLIKPTFKLLYEHCVNCWFERETRGKYSFSWLSIDMKTRVVPLLRLWGVTLHQLVT